MPMLIRLVDGVFSQVQDHFVRLGDDEPVAGGDAFVSLGRLLTGGVSKAGSGRLGVWLEPEDEVEALDGRLADPRVVIVPGPEKAMQASFATAGGTRVL